MPYQYDVFLSYRHNQLIKEWVEKAFLPQLRARLGEELNQPEARVFWDDDLHPGEEWYPALQEALQTSACLVPIWSPSYFQSQWCMAEWLTFHKRQQELGLGPKGIVVPVRWHDGDAFPEAARKVQQDDFTPFAYSGEGFLKSEKFMEFQDKVSALVKSVATGMNRAPPEPSPQWPLIRPEDVLRDTDGAATRPGPAQPAIPVQAKIVRPMLSNSDQAGASHAA